jgi:hypothetical protein
MGGEARFLHGGKGEGVRRGIPFPFFFIDEDIMVEVGSL